MLARQIAIGFGIAIIFPLLVYYGVSTFYAAPKATEYLRPMPPLAKEATTEERKARFEEQQKQRAAYNAAAKDFGRVLIAIATPLGVAAVIIGAFMPIHAIGTGLILGGILSVGVGYWTYWQHLEDWMRFLSLLAGFAILIFVGYRRYMQARPSST